MLSALIFAAAVAAPSTSTAPQTFVLRGEPAKTAELCRRGAMALPAAQRELAEAKKLAELPRPKHERTVMRRIDGCVAPSIVRENVGR